MPNLSKMRKRPTKPKPRSTMRSAAADIDALMALWADDEEIVCIHPGAPRLVGHAAIRASLEAIFERGGVHIRPAAAACDPKHDDRGPQHHRRSPPQRTSEQEIISCHQRVCKTPLGWRIVHAPCVDRDLA